MDDISYIGRSDLPRGLRDNNPGNIKTGIAWMGKTGVDGPFIIFKSMPWGLRALASDIANKIRLDGLTTIRQIITKYAPPDENDTARYIAAVVADTGYTADQQLPATPEMLHRMVRAITNHELGDDYGEQYITDDEIDQGIAMTSNSIKTFFQAMGLAFVDTFEDSGGNVQWWKVGVVLALVAGGVYFLRKSK